MIYISLSVIPQRLENLSLTIESLLNQTKKPDKIFVNIPFKYKRFSETIDEKKIPIFDSNLIEVIRGYDYGPGTKLLGPIKKLEKNSLIILVDDDHVYKNYMIEKFYYYFTKAADNAYSFFVYPVENFPVGQGADGFAINTDYLEGIERFYNKIVNTSDDLFFNDDLWISYFLYFIKKNKIFSLQNQLKKNSDGKSELIYEKRILSSGLIEMYGKDFNEAINKRNKILIRGFKYMQEMTKNLDF